MTLDNEILSKFYRILNVNTVTTAINGCIYLGEKPTGRELEDIVINVLTSKSQFNDELMVGIVNINCFAPSTRDNTRNTVRLNAITKAVLSALALTNGQGNSLQLHYNLDNQKTFRDNDNPNMYYSNIRLNFSHKNF